MICIYMHALAWRVNKWWAVNRGDKSWCHIHCTTTNSLRQRHWFFADHYRSHKSAVKVGNDVCYQNWYPCWFQSLRYRQIFFLNAVISPTTENLGPRSIDMDLVEFYCWPLAWRRRGTPLCHRMIKWRKIYNFGTPLSIETGIFKLFIIIWTAGLGATFATLTPTCKLLIL